MSAAEDCPTCEGSRSAGEPGFTYYGIPEPGCYAPCPDCMDDHGIPTGTAAGYWRARAEKAEAALAVSLGYVVVDCHGKVCAYVHWPTPKGGEWPESWDRTYPENAPHRIARLVPIEGDTP